MSATSLLFILIALFIIFNAGNLAQVAQGKAHFTFTGTGSRVSTGSSVAVSHGK